MVTALINQTKKEKLGKNVSIEKRSWWKKKRKTSPCVFRMDSKRSK